MTTLISFEMIAGLQLGQFANAGRFWHPGARLPVVGSLSRWKKIGQLEEKIAREPVHEWLVHSSQLGQFQFGRGSLGESDTSVSLQEFLQSLQRIGRQSVRFRRDRRNLEDQSQIHGRVPRDG